MRHMPGVSAAVSRVTCLYVQSAHFSPMTFRSFVILDTRRALVTDLPSCGSSCLGKRQAADLELVRTGGIKQHHEVPLQALSMVLT